MSPRRPFRIVPACSIKRRAARSSSLTNCPWMFMGFPGRRDSPHFRRVSSIRAAPSREKLGEHTLDFIGAADGLGSSAAEERKGSHHVARKPNKSNVLT